jgi:hypothetical protein
MAEKSHPFASDSADEQELTSLAQSPNEDWCIKHQGKKMLLDFGDSEYILTIQRHE